MCNVFVCNVFVCNVFVFVFIVNGVDPVNKSVSLKTSHMLVVSF